MVTAATRQHQIRPEKTPSTPTATHKVDPKATGGKRHEGGYGMKTHPMTILKMRLELEERCTEEAKS